MTTKSVVASAPGMLRREFTKLVFRPVCLLMIGTLCTLVAVSTSRLISIGESYPERAFALPMSWFDILRHSGIWGATFTCSIILLAVGGDFSLGMARQNIADGLSRKRFVAGNVLLASATGLGLWVLGVTVTYAVAIARGHTAESAPLSGMVLLAVAGGTCLALVATACFAMFVAIVVRSAASGLAIAFGYAVLEIMVGLTFGSVPESAPWLISLLPVAVIRGLLNPAVYGTAFELGLVTRGPAPVISLPLFALAAGLYSALCILLGWIVFRRRDLI